MSKLDLIFRCDIFNISKNLKSFRPGQAQTLCPHTQPGEMDFHLQKWHVPVGDAQEIKAQIYYSVPVNYKHLYK